MTDSKDIYTESGILPMKWEDHEREGFSTVRSVQLPWYRDPGDLREGDPDGVAIGVHKDTGLVLLTHKGNEYAALRDLGHIDEKHMALTPERAMLLARMLILAAMEAREIRGEA